jgi:AAA ATPase domain
VLSGPPGIGETRLAEEVAARAGVDGDVVWLSCPDERTTPPWWPMRQLVRALGADADDVLEVPQHADPDAARFQVYERIQHLIESAPGLRAVVVDDVQWADSASASCLAYIAGALRDHPIAMVVTVRDGEHIPEVGRLLGTVARGARNRHVAVSALSSRDVAALATVIGDAIDFTVLARSTRLDVDTLADYLDEAADERIVVTSHAGDGYAFAHGLLREQLLASMPALRRQRLHAKVAEVLADVGGDDSLTRRAQHLVSAQPLVEPDVVVDACRRAAGGHTALELGHRREVVAGGAGRIRPTLARGVVVWCSERSSATWSRRCAPGAPPPRDGWPAHCCGPAGAGRGWRRATTPETCWCSWIALPRSRPATRAPEPVCWPRSPWVDRHLEISRSARHIQPSPFQPELAMLVASHIRREGT